MKTTGLQATLITFFLLVLGYTLAVALPNNFDLLTPFLSNITSISWSGQFNLDFSAYLTLSGLWIMYRHQFSGKGIAMGLAAMVLGILLFAPYVWYQLRKAKGDLPTLLLGQQKAF